MRTRKVCLRAVMINREGRSAWSGEYACSICGQRFHPDPSDPAKLTSDFETHKGNHPAETGVQGDFDRTAN
jgi:hypothetical protein